MGEQEPDSIDPDPRPMLTAYMQKNYRRWFMTQQCLYALNVGVLMPYDDTALPSIGKPTSDYR